MRASSAFAPSLPGSWECAFSQAASASENRSVRSEPKSDSLRRTSTSSAFSSSGAQDGSASSSAFSLTSSSSRSVASAP